MNNYQILGLSSSATIVEVKASFKKLSLIHHPDKGGNANKFIQIREAYEAIVKAPEKEKQTFSQSDFSKDTFHRKRQEFERQREYFKKMQQEAERQMREQNKGQYSEIKIDLYDNKYRFTLQIRNITTIKILDKNDKKIDLFSTLSVVGSYKFFLTKSQMKECDYFVKVKLFDRNNNSIIKEFKIKRPPLLVERVFQKINNLLR